MGGLNNPSLEISTLLSH